MVNTIKKFCAANDCNVNLNYDYQNKEWIAHFWTSGYYHTKTFRWGKGKTIRIAFSNALKDTKKYEPQSYSEGY